MFHHGAVKAAQSDLKACQKLIGYRFTKIDLLFEALQAPGTVALSANRRVLKRGNENLAIVGDLALATVLSVEWYKNDTNTEKGINFPTYCTRSILLANANNPQATGNNNGATGSSATNTSPASAEPPA